MATLLYVKGMATLLYVKGMATLLYVKGMATLLYVKGMATLLYVKGMATLLYVKGMATLLYVKGMDTLLYVKGMATLLYVKGMDTLLYVKGITEPIQHILKHQEIATSVRPHQNIRRILVHPKDKVEDSKKTDCVYQIPCMSCNHTYIGKTGRTFGTRLEEHKEVETSQPDDLQENRRECQQ